MAQFTPIDTTTSLDAFFAQEGDQPAILFLHDPGCFVSMSAYQEVTKLPDTVALVNVQRAKDVSRAIAQRTGIKHESPQVIIIRQGQAIWSASHFAITAQQIQAVIQG